MNQLLFYVLQVIAASGLLYAYYHFALRNKKFHRYNRFYLLAAVIISIIIPFLNIPIYFSESQTDSSVVLQTLQVISSPVVDEPTSQSNSGETTASGISTTWFTIENILYFFYILILSFFLLRVLLSLIRIRALIRSNTAEKIDQIEFINTNERGTPFSFFRWLFWNRKIELNSEKGEQIFRHELFHIQQKHSWDTMFMEMISTIFWINPFFHLMKKELKAIHEFLADEFAITENRSWQYAELLLMQVLNTNNHLVNPFFHNQIKRRIAMITSSSKPSYQYVRKLMVLPVTALVIFLFAFTYKHSSKTDPGEFENSINSITVVVDAGHGGSDPGAKSPDGKYTESALTLEISKTIRELGPEFNVNVIVTREDEALPGGTLNRTDALKKRIEIAKQYNPQAFISIHINSMGLYGKYQDKYSGFEAYISDEKPDKENILFAKKVLGELKPIFKTDPGVKQREGKGIYVLDKNSFPSILLQCGFINNKKDISFITDKTNQEKVARAILKAIVTFANGSHKEDGSTNFIDNTEGNQIRIPGSVDLTTNGKAVQDTNKIFVKLQQEASFPGGAKAWADFVRQNISANVPFTKKAPFGTYSVIVQFIVDREGNISDLRTLTKHGYGMEDEALRVIRLSGKWNPGIQNGHIVKSYKKQPVTFVITDDATKQKKGTTSLPFEKVRSIQQLKTTLSDISSMFGEPGKKNIDNNVIVYIYMEGASRLDVLFDRSTEKVNSFHYTIQLIL